MSAVSAKTQDPSMDEILASIRRIIADDQDAPKPAGPAADGDQSRGEDEVLDLADLPHAKRPAEPSHPIDLEPDVPEIAFRSVPEPVAPPAPDPPPTAAPVLATVEPARSDPEPAPVDSQRPAPAATRIAEPAPSPAPAAAPPPKAAASPAVAPSAGSLPARPDPSLVSTETTAAVSHAFSLLSHTILTQNSRTLEDLVGDMLKPMLKVWLDDNLPPLVERLVRQEIERVARGIR